MRVSKIAIAIAVFGLSVAPALADDDGSASNCFIFACADIDVANGSIGNNELAPGAVSEPKLDVPLAAKINSKVDAAYVAGQIAGITIDGSEIVDGTVTGQDVQNGSLTGRDVKNGSLTGHDIKNGSIEGKDIKNGSVTGRDIKDHSIKGKDIGYGTVTGANIKNGSVKKEDLSWRVRKQMDEATDAIGSLETLTDGHSAALNAHDALLSEHAATLKNHGARLDEQEKGIAIAMAMPDTWLSDTERFAVAGNVGFFGDEAALAFAGIARIDQNWSMNAGFGSDTGFKQFGGKVGVRAGW